MTTPRLVETAAFLAIGNELLTGKVREANLFELAQTLRSLGITLTQVSILPDDVEILAPAIRALSLANDVVVTSGGVGPTHDDVTMSAVAAAFERRVVRDPVLEQLVRKTFAGRVTETHLRFADVPEGAELRSAPDVDWPTPVLNNVWILPGVPEVFRMKLSTLRSWVKGPVPFVSRAVLLTLDEVDLKLTLDAVVEAHRAVSVGSYPALFNPRYRTRITFDATDEAHVAAALSDLLARLGQAPVVAIE